MGEAGEIGGEEGQIKRIKVEDLGWLFVFITCRSSVR